MLGPLYEHALQGERCWIRYDDGEVTVLPVQQWLGEQHADEMFDDAVVGLCDGPTIELGCGPGRLVSKLIRRGTPALGIDQSPAAVGLATRRGALAILGDVFGPLPGVGGWQTVLLADGSVGLGGDPQRLLRRAADLLSSDGHCVAEFDAGITNIRVSWVRLECRHSVGPWFRWASAGIGSASALAAQAGLELSGVHRIGERVVATLTARSNSRRVVTR